MAMGTEKEISGAKRIKPPVKAEDVKLPSRKQTFICYTCRGKGAYTTVVSQCISSTNRLLCIRSGSDGRPSELSKSTQKGRK